MEYQKSVSPFRVKICGVTTADDARLVVAEGADAIGLNFYPESSRFVDQGDAENIVRAIPPEVKKVGVFVNATANHVTQLATRLELDLVQLHGDEPPEFLAELPGLTIIRAFRCRDHRLRQIADYLQRCQQFSPSPPTALLDAFHQTQFGGTGHTLDWSQLQSEIVHLGGVPWVLAGGLAAENVASAITKLHPTGVDTASGVERSPGRKDPTKVRAFVRAALAAYD